jgi:hypothetical protein
MMKKTVTLTSLIKAKNDLELYIKVDQMKRLKQLFVPTFDIKDLNSKIETKEDQLILIKEAIGLANATTLDEEGHTLNYSIYRLSKYNRLKSDLLTIQRRLETDDFLSDNETFKNSLLKDIGELDDLIKKETDKKVIADRKVAKAKLKRSLSKISTNTKSHTTDLSIQVKKDLADAEIIITQIKSVLSKLNDSTKVVVEVAEEFEIVLK